MWCNEIVVLVLIDKRENIGEESDRLWASEDMQGVSFIVRLAKEYELKAISSQWCCMKY